MQFGDTTIEARLDPRTEEWAEEVLAVYDEFEFERTEDAFIVRVVVGGNCDAVQLVGSFCRDLEDGLTEGNISPRSVTITAERKD